MKIVDFKCTQIGPYPVLRLVTDTGIDGFGTTLSQRCLAIDLPAADDDLLRCVVPNTAAQAEFYKGDQPGAVNIVSQVRVYRSPLV